MKKQDTVIDSFPMLIFMLPEKPGLVLLCFYMSMHKNIWELVVLQNQINQNYIVFVLQPGYRDILYDTVIGINVINCYEHYSGTHTCMMA